MSTLNPSSSSSSPGVAGAGPDGPAGPGGPGGPEGHADEVEAPWAAHWIAVEPPPEGDPAAAMLFGGGRAGFSRCMFRREFEVAAVRSVSPARISADSRYLLFVNGAEVGRGPARSQPLRQRYDTWDLAPYLRPGRNVVAALVTYYGKPTSFWMPAPPGGVIGRDAVLVFEAAVGPEVLVTDEAWRVHRSSAWTLAAPTSGLDGLPVEVVDARLIPSGWQSLDFDDPGWDAATVLTAVHVGGLGRDRPPTYPYGRLRPRGISQPTGGLVEPHRVTAARAGAIEEGLGHPVERVQQLLSAPSGLEFGDATLPLTLDVGPDGAVLIAVDFGRVVAGFFEIDVDGPPGVEVDCYYREREFRAGAVTASDPTTGARFVSAGGPGTLSGTEINGLRFAYLALHAPEAGRATLGAVRAREYLYPRPGSAYFASSDPSLDGLYRAGVRTVQLNSFDSYTDCPTREQRSWVGDGVVHQQVDLATNADWGLARNYVVVGDSPRSDGILPMSVVGDIESSGGVTIPDWALHWVHGVHNLYRYEGDLDFVAARLPSVQRVLRWYAAYADQRGTIADVPEWNLVDWASIFTSGRSSILTGLWARGLAELAELGDAVGDRGTAAWARARYEAAQKGFEDFYDPSRGLYADHIVDDERRPAASQAANAVAVVSGLAPPERWDGIVERITDPARLVVRSWIGGADGGYDFKRFAEVSRGILRIDWDVEREIVLAEPFFSYVVHDAVARSGRAGQLTELVRRWDQFLVDGYDTFGECWGWGTPVHGWSATPARDLVVYVLGISPAEPGFTRARVAPRLGGLAEAAGSVPTPHGFVEVRISGGEAEIDSPVPVLFVREDGSEHALGSGQTRMSLQ
jgi:alpha-L-rhamnosidase